MAKIVVMLAGVPGKMASLVATAVVAQPDMMLYPHALSEYFGVDDFGPFGSSTRVILECTDRHEKTLKEARDTIDMVVDFTQPRSVDQDVQRYCRLGIPFVMGTTGGDREKMAQTVRESSISAVIAPNMATPVVMLQAMLRFAATNFPGALNGYKVVVRESHRESKPDLSGTALELLGLFKKLGATCPKENILMVRDKAFQRDSMLIPKEFLDAHAYHRYVLTSPDGTVVLGFEHNLLGNQAYVNGCLAAIRFLATKKGTKGQVFPMPDVLMGASL